MANISKDEVFNCWISNGRVCVRRDGKTEEIDNYEQAIEHIKDIVLNVSYAHNIPMIRD